MQSYQFTFLVADDPRDLAAWSDALYEAGGDDSEPGIDKRGHYVYFDREAATMDDALRSAAETIRKAGLIIVRCQIEAEELTDVVGAA